MTDQTSMVTLHDAEMISKALDVLHLLVTNPRMTQEKACANIGISQPAYRKWISTQEEALISFEQARQEIEREQLSRYLISKRAIVDQLLNDAMKSGVSITERLKALDHVEKRIDELSDAYHHIDVDAEKDLLSGPNQIPGTSKLANRVLVENDENGTTTITVKKAPDIINLQQ